MNKTAIILLMCLLVFSSCTVIPDKQIDETAPGTVDYTVDGTEKPFTVALEIDETLPYETEESVASETNVPETDIPETEAPETAASETLPDETPTPPETTDVVDDIGGSHMGDMLYPRYVVYVDNVGSVDGTFSEEYWNYIPGYVAMEEEWGHSRPCILYYLVQETGADRANIERYFDARGIENVPERIYQGLLSDDPKEAMQLLKSDYSFYHDGNLYNVYDVYNMNASKSLTFDPSDAAYDEVWENIGNLMELTGKSLDPNVEKFIVEHTKSN